MERESLRKLERSVDQSNQSDPINRNISMTTKVKVHSKKAMCGQHFYNYMAVNAGQLPKAVNIK